MGNVKGGPAFTHISYDDYRVVRANFLEGKTASIKGRLVPYTVFTDPQLGRVGITEAEARSKSMDIEIVKMAMSHVALPSKSTSCKNASARRVRRPLGRPTPSVKKYSESSGNFYTNIPRRCGSSRQTTSETHNIQAKPGNA